MIFFRKPVPPASSDPIQEALAQLRAEIQQLKAGRSQIEGILQSMAEGVLVVDPAGRLLLVNDSAREILGMGSTGRPGQALAEAARQPGIRDLVARVLQTRQPEMLELELYSPSERTLEVRAVICPVPGAGECALLVFHDVTELKRLEQIRREFVANVSHELKTPLTTIQGSVETLLDGALEEPEHARGFLAAIKEETERLRHLVEDLLSLAQVESQPAVPRREPTAVKPLLQEVLTRYASLAQTRHMTIHLEVPGSLPVLRADPDQLALAIGNLLDNAIKYNRSGGQIHLRAGQPDAGHLSIEVEDNGIGIPPEDLPRVFERFYRVDKARSRESGGTGLGLSIVKHVVEAHGGSVRADSTPNHGSRFTLLLPL